MKTKLNSRSELKNDLKSNLKDDLKRHWGPKSKTLFAICFAIFAFAILDATFVLSERECDGCLSDDDCTVGQVCRNPFCTIPGPEPITFGTCVPGVPSCTATGSSCDDHAECCSGYCTATFPAVGVCSVNFPTLNCNNRPELCNPGQSCCADGVCRDECPTNCQGNGAACTVSSNDCCSGCCLNGACASASGTCGSVQGGCGVKKKYGFPCSQDTDCCGGHCCNGICQRADRLCFLNSSCVGDDVSFNVRCTYDPLYPQNFQTDCCHTNVSQTWDPLEETRDFCVGYCYDSYCYAKSPENCALFGCVSQVGANGAYCGANAEYKMWRCTTNSDCKFPGQYQSSCGEAYPMTTESCSERIPADSDFSLFAYFEKGNLTNYTCSAGECAPQVYDDSCDVTGILTELGVDANNKSASTTKRCSDYSFSFCNQSGSFNYRSASCRGVPGACTYATAVHTGTNQDLDSWDLQCGDSLCDNSSGVSNDTKTINETGVCNDGLDNDCDNRTDCDDSDCTVGGACCSGSENTALLCSDTLDNDCDGKIDCADPECGGLTVGIGLVCCTPTNVTANCGNDDCINETCSAGNLCQYTPRQVCDATECALGSFCNAPGGDCKDADTDSAVCSSCAAKPWLPANETAVAALPTYPVVYPFGGYSARGEIECCGNQAGQEFNVSLFSRVGCCNASTDCIDSFGICRIGYENDSVLCSNGIDDDCDGSVDLNENDCFGNISGVIYDGESLSSSIVIPGTLVRGLPPSLPEAYESNATSNFEGKYKITKAIVGTYPFIARKEGYVDSIKTLTITSNAAVTQDFYLYKGINCKPDCTDQNDYCSVACDGLVFETESGTDTCNLVSDRCSGRPKGFKVTYVNDSGYYYEITCCEDSAPRIYPALKPQVSGSVDSIYDYKTPIKIGTKTYLLHILVWDKQ